MSEVLLSQLAYAELISPKPEETVKWMVDVLGLEVAQREGQSVYLRGWAEWLHSSLIVTEGPETALGSIGWRAYGPGDPEILAERVEASAREWAGSSAPGRGAAYQYRAPHGQHLHEVFWEVERYEAPPEKADHGLLNRPQKNPGRGAQARYIDHVTIASPKIVEDIEFYKTLGQRHTAIMHVEPGFNVFATMTCNGIRPTHDLGIVPDFSGATGRVNHIAFRVDQRSTSSAPPRRSWPPTRRSSSVRASTASTRSPTSTCASRAACASRSTPAAGSTPSPTSSARTGTSSRAARRCGRTSRCRSR